MEITAVEPRRKGLVQLYLDGEPAVKLDRETFLVSGLGPGDRLDDTQLCQLIQASDARRAKEKALYLLGHRSHSKKELIEKITRTTAGREAAQAAADRMEELGLIDDQAYGRNLAKELFRQRGYGARRVKHELRLKGIQEELIEELLEEFGGEDQAVENIRRILEKKYAGWQEDEKLKRRAYGALQRYGYSYEEIREGMRGTWED